MAVMPGYKNTVLGIIPNEWDVKPLDELFEFRNGVNADKHAYGKGIRFINVLEPITYSHIYGPEIRGQVTLSESVTASYAVQRGDVLFNRTSETESEIGLAATYLGTEKVVFGGFVIRGRPIGDKLDPIYSGYALRAPHVRSQIIPMGQGGIRANIGQNSLSRVIVPIPPSHEQCAIGEALSDVDGMLGGLDRLIVKKHELRQAAKQQLLTGQIRLSGFHGEWKVKKLPDICLFRNGKAHEQYISELGQFVCVNSKFISTDGKERKYSIANFCCAKENDILMVMSDLPNGRALAKTYLVEQSNLYAVNQRVCSLTAYQDCPQFLAYILNRNSYFLKFDDGVSQTHLLNKVFLNCTLRIPPTVPEQSAIATILMDMDAELAKLEQRRKKTYALKQAMMQELLTGHTRLK